jgi:hypothetical protein
MKSRPNGDAGVKVWLVFRKEGALKGFTYASGSISASRASTASSIALPRTPL